MPEASFTSTTTSPKTFDNDPDANCERDDPEARFLPSVKVGAARIIKLTSKSSFMNTYLSRFDLFARSPSYS